jgi:hypothetical protein
VLTTDRQPFGLARAVLAVSTPDPLADCISPISVIAFGMEWKPAEDAPWSTDWWAPVLVAAGGSVWEARRENGVWIAAFKEVRLSGSEAPTHYMDMPPLPPSVAVVRVGDLSRRAALASIGVTEIAT